MLINFCKQVTLDGVVWHKCLSVLEKKPFQLCIPVEEARSGLIHADSQERKQLVPFFYCL